MPATYSRADVRTHADGPYAESRPAINVKVYTGPEDADYAAVRADTGAGEDFTAAWILEHLTENALEDYWGIACETAFEHACEDAREVFGDRVECHLEGRSGGWLVVDGLPELEDWDARMLGRWRRFERYCRAYVADVPYLFADLVALNVYLPMLEHAANVAQRERELNAGRALAFAQEG